MNRTERLSAILDLLAESGQVAVDDLAPRLGVSPATARRDLDALATGRLVSRTRGGATHGSVAYDLPGRYNRDDHSLQKQQIARAASELIPKGAVIGLCGGTTTTALAQVLSTRADLMEASNGPTLTVVTNAINIAAQLAVRPQFKIMVSGGILNPRSYELVGPYTDTILQNVALDFTFVGVHGIDPVIGPTINDESEAAANSLMALRATEAYVLADSSKVGRRSCATMEGYHFNKVITDSAVTSEQLSAFKENGIHVIIAPDLTDTDI
ncbi:DeoR/GlpR family DNA-binding transcription regulator [Arthrobacter sp. KNU-44]|uniref:DeoR/GlpR family DNA-binding transcription regulator n=1 Tax=Arthrobacter sp. KNU-44 TaxID=3450744 RepID=UPI003F428808